VAAPSSNPSAPPTRGPRCSTVATGTGMVARATGQLLMAASDWPGTQSADMLAAGLRDGRPRVRAQGERRCRSRRVVRARHVPSTCCAMWTIRRATIRELTRVLRQVGDCHARIRQCQPTLSGASCGACTRASVCRSQAACCRVVGTVGDFSGTEQRGVLRRPPAGGGRVLLAGLPACRRPSLSSA